MIDQLDRMAAYASAWKPPAPDEDRAYIIGHGPFRIKVTIKGVPPCLWCAEPVTELSCDGPLVCCWCDCGSNKDGSKWTDEQYMRRREHFQKMVTEYKARSVEGP